MCVLVCAFYLLLRTSQLYACERNHYHLLPMQLTSVLLTGLLALSTFYLLTRIRKTEKDLVFINQISTQQLSVEDVRRIVNRLTQPPPKLSFDAQTEQQQQQHASPPPEVAHAAADAQPVSSTEEKIEA